VIRKVRALRDTIVVASCLLVVVGCLTPHARYTRPSHQKRGREKEPGETGQSGKETRLISTDEIFEHKLKTIVDSYVGVPYRYGGTTRRGMDCSGFVFRVYNDLGCSNVPRTSSAKLSRIGTPVTRSELRIGDLVFFRKRRRIDHVGIYMGDDTFAHASSKKGITYTRLDSEYFRNRLVCIRRID